MYTVVVWVDLVLIFEDFSTFIAENIPIYAVIYSYVHLEILLKFNVLPHSSQGILASVCTPSLCRWICFSFLNTFPHSTQGVFPSMLCYCLSASRYSFYNLKSCHIHKRILSSVCTLLLCRWTWFSFLKTFSHFRIEYSYLCCDILLMCISR